jgi:diguanylate cyclase (GGDEF)-like protein
VFFSADETIWNTLDWDESLDILYGYLGGCKPNAMLIDIEDLDIDEIVEFAQSIRLARPLSDLFIIVTYPDTDNATISRMLQSGISDLCESGTNVEILKRRLDMGARLIQQQHKLSGIHNRLEKIETLVDVGFLEWSLVDDKIICSENTCRILGLAPESKAASMRLLLEKIVPDQRDRIEKQITAAADNPSALKIECKIQHADDNTRDIVIILEPEIPDDSPGYLVGYLQDVTKQKLREEQIRELSDLDTITGLANKKLITHQLKSTIEIARRHKKQFSLLQIEIDGFSEIMKSHGQEFSDQLLRVISARMIRQIRREDILARVDDNKFNLLIPEQDSEYTAAYCACKLRQAFSYPLSVADKQVQVNLIIGIAVYPKNGETYLHLSEAAEQATRNAISSDTGYAFLSKQLNQKVIQRLHVENALKKAVEDNAFCLHYQPKLSPSTGMIVGMEALVRWEHPEHGIISPAEFIPLAESTGLIHPLGQWVLENACQEAARWRDRKNKLTIAINVSPKQLEQTDFCSHLKNTLERTSLLPADVELEVTESCMQASHRILDTLENCRQLGVKVAIDDFGTGYSSLSSLKNLPVDTLKIDKVFMAGVPSKREDEAIMSAIIHMADILGLEVVAEGVENREHISYLQKIGCSLAQGFFIAKPTPASEVDTLLGLNYQHLLSPDTALA